MPSFSVTAVSEHLVWADSAAEAMEIVNLRPQLANAPSTYVAKSAFERSSGESDYRPDNTTYDLYIAPARSWFRQYSKPVVTGCSFNKQKLSFDDVAAILTYRGGYSQEVCAGLRGNTTRELEQYMYDVGVATPVVFMIDSCKRPIISSFLNTFASIDEWNDGHWKRGVAVDVVTSMLYHHSERRLRLDDGITKFDGFVTQEISDTIKGWLVASNLYLVITLNSEYFEVGSPNETASPDYVGQDMLKMVELFCSEFNCNYYLKAPKIIQTILNCREDLRSFTNSMNEITYERLINFEPRGGTEGTNSNEGVMFLSELPRMSVFVD